MSSRVNGVNAENLQDPPIKNPGYANDNECAENYNKWLNKFILLTAISILVISTRNSSRVLFDKIASVYFIWKI